LIALDDRVAEATKERLGRLGQQHELRNAAGDGLLLERGHERPTETVPTANGRDYERPQQPDIAVTLEPDCADGPTRVVAYDPERQLRG
jgi:hypothetical protein